MSSFLRQSTLIVIKFGPFVSPTDGVTLVTSLVGTGSNQLENTSTGIMISKAGGGMAARHATATASAYDAYGEYRVTLDTTDTNTLGQLRVSFAAAASCLPVWRDFVVLSANVYDSLVNGNDLLDVSLVQVAGSTTNVSTLATGAAAIQVKTDYLPSATAGAAGGVFIAGANAATSVTTALTANITGNISGSIGSVTAIAANAVNASALATDAVTEIVTAVLTTAMTEAYSTKNGTLTVAQALHELIQNKDEVSTGGGTTLTTKKRDQSTTAVTHTLNNASAPTSRTRAT